MDRKTAFVKHINEGYACKGDYIALGIGEALVTALSEKGIPTPLAATMLRAPVSRMDILTPAEITAINSSSVLVQKYSQTIDRESAYEILSRKVSEDKAVKEEGEKGRRGDWEMRGMGDSIFGKRQQNSTG